MKKNEISLDLRLLTSEERKEVHRLVELSGDRIIRGTGWRRLREGDVGPHYNQLGRYEGSWVIDNGRSNSKDITLDAFKTLFEKDTNSVSKEQLRQAYNQGYEDAERMEKKDFDLFYKNLQCKERQ